MGGNQKFEYEKGTKLIRHSGTGKCVSVKMDDTGSSHPIIEVCNPQAQQQKWLIATNDMKKSIPEWAKIAEDLYEYPIP